MKVTKEGYPFLIPLLLITVLLFILRFPVAGFFLLLLSFATGWFFRDPERIIPPGENLILAPADGVVVEAGEEGDKKKVSIFMRLFDVHINRSPISGKITDSEYKKGRFHPAFRPEAGSENEQHRITLVSRSRRIELTQIAGVIARRISFWKKVGDEVKAGERIGMIKFGSRVELVLPREASLLVKVGDKVKAGETIIGELN